jgi:hypothetical protein
MIHVCRIFCGLYRSSDMLGWGADGVDMMVGWGGAAIDGNDSDTWDCKSDPF